jgi:hypothetical protein
MVVRSRIPVILAGAYAVLGVLSILPIFTGEGPLSGIFAVLLGSPWTQLLSSALGTAGMSSPSPAAGLGLVGIGIAVNTTLVYLVSRWLVRRGTSR